MKNINGSELREIVAKNSATVIDVRTKEELLAGVIEGAINIDVMSADFTSKINELDQSKTYVVVCRSGNRSGSACGYMNQQGFEKVYNLAGGMMNYDGEVV